MRDACLHVLLCSTLGALVACSGIDTGPPDPPDPPTCPQVLPEATVSCTTPACSATTGTKAFALGDVTAADATSWLVISYVGSELFTNETVNLTYGKAASGALLAKRRAHQVALRDRLSPDDYETLFGAARQGRLNAERKIRAASVRDRPAGPLLGTAVRGRGEPDEETLEQDTTCSVDAPACGDTALCVIPAGATDGQCESSLVIKWRNQPSLTDFETVDATVRRVGTFGAIVTDDADTISDDDVNALSSRFEERIAPLDHTFFGEPKDGSGRDRDGNGVVILFLTSRVAQIDADLAGFFQATDLQNPTDIAGSNGADILYMQPPGASVTLDNLSGTLAHEYEHLISYYAKVINRQSSAEERWLDEGMASFAEDLQGYGADSFKNIAAYLVSVGDTSLTGFGLLADNESEADSNARRGMAHLLLRYLYEQKGGATITGASDVADGGGVAAIRAMVQSADTGVDLFSAGATGRSFETWMKDLLTVVAIDGANYDKVSCNPNFTLADPEPDAYTGYTRGIDLRTSMTDFSGATIPLNGPSTASFDNEDVPVPSNGGEVRTLQVSQGAVQVSLSGDADALGDFFGGLRILPAN